ncbi:MAG: hypothetical protein OEL52_01870 [Nitrosopumilus sp.]|nr:hypothetical protein [Nitrosopumilus sp.]
MMPIVIIVYVIPYHDSISLYFVINFIVKNKYHVTGGGPALKEIIESN